MTHIQGDIGWDVRINTFAALKEDGVRHASLTSDGGSLIEGWGIHDYIKANDLLDSITCYGMVASSATIIMAAVPKRIGSQNSKYVIHNPWTMQIGDAEKMQKTANELMSEQERLINFYVGVTGKDYDFIKNLMAEERALTATEALELGLITDILQPKMSDKAVTKTDLENSMQSIFDRIKNFLRVKNMVVQSTDGTELEFDSDVEQISQIAVGGGLKANGAPANGEFILADGTKVVAEAGKITEVAPADAGGNEEVEALKAELEAAKAELAEAQNKVGELTNSLTAANSEVVAIKNDLTTFKNKFSNYTPPANTPANGGDNHEPKKFSFKKK